MSRNLLPFEWHELARYGWSPTALRLTLLRWGQCRTFRKANGMIFLTDYARNKVGKVTGPLRAKVATIPHGVEVRPSSPKRTQRSIAECSREQPFRILYVSIIDLYKHQWQVAEAVATLVNEGLPISITFAGPSYKPALDRLEQAMNRLDPTGQFLNYVGPVAPRDLPAYYAAADLCMFASTCENMPNILLEGMASGLPIACSERGPMPEVLGNGGVFFNPESPVSIAAALRRLIQSKELRQEISQIAYGRAQHYSWQRCADETFGFLEKIAFENK